MIVTSKVDFKPIEELGSGGYAKVYRVEDPQLDAELAMKRIPRSEFTGKEHQFFYEAAAIYDCRHLNVVEIKYASLDDDYVNLAMPIMAGGSLKDRLACGRFTVRELVRTGLDILSGLLHVHIRGRLHLDLHPGNVLFDAAGHGALTDFGLSRHLNPHGVATPEGQFPPYYPPEGLISTDRTVASDVYQVGMLLYEMANGAESIKRQYKRARRQSLQLALENGTYPDRSNDSMAPHLPPPLVTLIKRSLKSNPDDRPSLLSAMNALAGIESVLDWRFEEEPGLQTWTNERNLSKVCLIEETGGCWKIESTKPHGSRMNRVKAHCSGPFVSPASARKAVHSALNALD